MEHLPSHLRSALGLYFPLSALPDGISGDPAVWTGASEWDLFREGHVAPQRNDNPGRVRSKAGIGWLRSQEHGRGQEVLAKGHLGPLLILEAPFARAGTHSGRMKDVHGGGTSCGVVGRGQVTPGPLGQLVVGPP